MAYKKFPLTNITQRNDSPKIIRGQYRPATGSTAAEALEEAEERMAVDALRKQCQHRGYVKRVSWEEAIY